MRMPFSKLSARMTQSDITGQRQMLSSQSQVKSDTVDGSVDITGALKHV